MSMKEDVDSYLDTLARMENDIHMVDASAGWASIAISLRRIADSLARIEKHFPPSTLGPGHIGGR